MSDDGCAQLIANEEVYKRYKHNMPWLEERTLTLFVRDTEVRRYEPGVRERGVDVERAGGPLVVGPGHPDAHGALPLEAPVVHGHLVGQHPRRALAPPAGRASL